MAGTTTKPDKWELTKVGTDIISRTSNIALDVQSYRDLINLKPNQHTQMLHNDYIHAIGQDMLKIQSTNADIVAASASSPSTGGRSPGRSKPKSNKNNKKLLRRDIKVHEMDDGGQSIMIDLEWDTSTWGDAELQGGIESLIEIFQLNCSYDKKQQAIRMLTKLLERHEVAIKHMRSNIQPIMNRAISKRLNSSGQLVAALNLLYILNCSKQQFSTELSHNNFIGLFMEMLLIELKLAATLIQHFYRTFRELKLTKHRPLGELAQGWTSQMEIYKARQRSISLRTYDLKRKWRQLHQNKIKKGGDNKILYGLSGPAHMDLTYDLLGLEISEHLLSSKAKDYAPKNREDGLLSNSPIILSLFMAATRGSMSYISLKILRHMALSPHSILSFIPMGIINSCLKYLHFHLKIQKNSNSTHVIETLELITRLGHHAAGIERAIEDHSYRVSQGSYCDDTHPIVINYKDLLMEYKGKIPDFRLTLGCKEICQLLYELILTSTDIAILRSALMTVFILSCSICYTNILEILTQSAGLLLAKLIDFFEYSSPSHEEESVLGDLSLCILIQQCTHEPSRAGLLSSHITSLLKHLFNEHIYFTRLSYKRALAVMVALSRIGEWRSYDPMRLLHEVQKSKQLVYFTYMDLMKTIKQPPPDTESLNYSMSFSDLMLLPSDSFMISELSEIAYRVGVKELCDFFTCPLDEKYFSTLSWDMASAGCSIISSLVSKSKSADAVLSISVIKYLGNCFYFGFTEISNKTLTEYESCLLLSGCYAAVDSLAVLCQSGHSHPDRAKAVVTGIIESNAASAANYFLNTFSNSLNTLLPVKIKDLQELVALTSIKFLERYTSCLLAIHSTETDELMTSVAQTIGSSTCRVLSQLNDAFGRSPKTLRILDDLCQLLARITEPSGGTSLALRNWNLVESLVVHLPQPLVHVGEVYSEELVYRNGIIQLPRSVFDLMSSLCKVEQGKALCFSEGFLRRALDKIALTVHHLEGDEELAFRIKQIEKGMTEEIDENRLDIASCLRLVALTANFNNPKYGSANEMILHPNFRLIDICARLLNSFVCPRDDKAFLAAIKLLRYLARDANRVYDLFKSYHIVSIIAREIQNVDTIPADGIIDMVDFTYHVAMGMKGKHIRKELPKMRDPLTKIARIYFRLGEGVSDVLWAISRNHEGANVDLINEGPIQSDEIEELKRQSIQQDLIDKKITMKPGTYEACGVGTCGSLRMGGVSSCHGELDDTNPENEKRRLELLRTQREQGGDYLELTNEYANKKLQKEVLKRKKMMGLYEDDHPKKGESSLGYGSGYGSSSGGSLRTGKGEGQEWEEGSLDKSSSYSPSLKSSTSTAMFPSFEKTKYQRNMPPSLSSSAPGPSSASYSASTASASSPSLDPAMRYEPLWKKPDPKLNKRKGKKNKELTSSSTMVISIDLTELPQLVSTKPAKPSFRLHSPK